MLTKADLTRQYIIEHAAPLFNKKGYAGTSMKDIMIATGLAKGGIYGNFESKDDVAAAAFDFSYQKLLSSIRLKIGPEKTATGRLMAIVNFYRNFSLYSSVEGGCVLLNTAIDADDAYPFLKKKAKAALKELLGWLQGYFESGVNKNEFRRTIRPRREAEMLFAMIEGGIMMAKLSDDHGTLNRVLDDWLIHFEQDIVKS
jgi:TetR/AcrR family transcriptional regulator, transcriptional repressor for nem operon